MKTWRSWWLAWLLVPGAGGAEAPQLIPFQGRLTDQQGQVYADGQFSVLFQIYAEPVGGTALWDERHEKVGVINGMLNVFLGSIEPLTGVDFSQTRHLGITIDADNNPNTPDPEMLPRQMIIPAFWARHSDNSTRLAGYDWSQLFGVNNPTGPLPGTKLQAGSITAAQIAPLTITSNQLAAGSVGSAQIVNGAVRTEDLGDGQITVAKLAQQLIEDTVFPPGVILPYASPSLPPPRGWLLCDGRFVSRTEYARLFGVLGTVWGAGVDGNTFRVPDLRGMFLRGVSMDSGRDPDAASRPAVHPGGATGNAVGSYQADAFKEHNHKIGTQGNNNENFYGLIPGGLSGYSGGHNRATGFEGGSETRPKNVNVHYIIKY